MKDGEMQDIDEDHIDGHQEEANYLLVFLDTMITFLCVVLCFVGLLILQDHYKKATPSLNTIGVMCVELSWPERNIDLDLWGHSPKDPDTVGYSNMHGNNLNLIRDVIGYSGNPTHQMLEMQCADQLTPGEYVFNVHYFANHESELASVTEPTDPRFTIEATMLVRIRNPNSKGDIDSFMTKFTLTKVKQEKTMLRFVVTSDGKVDHASINDRDIFIKQGWKGINN
jgi:hypothetical protein